jgi:hypothetical protein
MFKIVLKYKILIIDKYFPKIVMQVLRRTMNAPKLLPRFETKC